jgi:uncharacterized protein (TIGR03086 family)
VETVRTAHLDPGIVDQLSEALGSAAALIDGLPQPALTAATPCGGWRVIDVVNHLAAVTEKFGRFAAGAPSPIRQRRGDLVGAQPKERFRELADAALGAWRQHPEALSAVCVLSFGSFDGATAAGINLLDAVVHRWDIAVGAGAGAEMNEELAGVALRVADLLVTDEARRSGQYATALDAGAGASPSARLLTATGRRPAAGPGAP